MVHRVGRVENRWQLGPAYSALRRAAFDRSADLYVAHSEAAMAVALDLSRSGRRVALDMEDWFSEDLMPNRRGGRPLHLLRSFEAQLLTNSAYVSCTSLSMSEALASEFRCPSPVVIYNAFSLSERKVLDGVAKDRRDRAAPSMHWFSQTLGPGRGLEDLIAALPLVHQTAELHLRGVPTAGFEAWILQRIPANWRNRVFIHGLVPNDELLSRITEHDIGLAGEQNYCRNRNLTVSNKILYYLLAGLAVVASDTAGQREIAELAPDAVLLHPIGDATALATRLNELLARPDILARKKAAALCAAEKVFCWEHQREVLLQTVARALYEPEMGYRFRE
jgi:glycosyltransferase involved in cell wall biosynthesis